MEPIIGSARLFDALEHMGQSPGADMRSPWGPSGMPSEDAQRAFREAMEPPAQVDAAGGAAQGTENSQAMSFDAPENMPGHDSAGTVDAVSQTPPPLAPGPAEAVPGPQSVDGSFRIEGVSHSEAPQTDPGRGLSGLLDGGSLTPVELYQLQYQVGMLRGHLGVLMKSSQSLTQSLESTLKQSG